MPQHAATALPQRAAAIYACARRVLDARRLSAISITISEFRMALKSISEGLGLSTGKEEQLQEAGGADDLFHMLDADHSNDLTLAELEKGLTGLSDKLARTEQQRWSAAADVAEADYWRQRAALYDVAINATVSTEAIEAELSALTDQSVLEQKRNALLSTKGLAALFPQHGGRLRAAELLAKLREMRGQRQLGSEDATDAELEALTLELDVQGDGVLSLHGLNDAIRRSQAAMTSLRDRIQQVCACVRARRVATARRTLCATLVRASERHSHTLRP